MSTSLSEREQGVSTLNVVMESIDPETAKEYLALNVEHNRSVRDWKVTRYAYAMQQGRWIATSSTIKFDTNGHLLDGQHRLLAIIEAGIAVDMMVSRGEDPNSIHVIDVNTPRNAADSLVVSGVASKTNATQLAGLANALNGYENGFYVHAMSELNNADRLANDEMIEFVRDRNGSMHEALVVANKVLRLVPLNRSGVAVAYLVLKKLDPDAADEFFNRLAEGILHGGEDPLVVLTRKATSERLMPNRKNLVGTTLYLIFRTWNAWRTGETLGKFQYGSKGGGWTVIPKPI
jgi:ribosomal silencing factor RsfS